MWKKMVASKIAKMMKKGGSVMELNHYYLRLVDTFFLMDDIECLDSKKMVLQ